MNDGVNKQCTTHTKDSEIAILSTLNFPTVITDTYLV